MRVPRCFRAGVREGLEVDLGPAAFRHLVQVLRREEGDSLEIADGEGAVFEARILRLDRGEQQLRVAVGRPVADLLPSILPVHVAVGIPRGDALEVAIRLGSETGLASLTPLITERTVARPREGSKKIERWRRIALESAEQCRRAVPLEVQAPVPLAEYLGEREREEELPNTFIALPGGEPVEDSGFLADRGEARVIVGPEGGFSPGELETVGGLGIRSLGFPGPVMKTATAVVFVGAVARLGHREPR